MIYLLAGLHEQRFSKLLAGNLERLGAPAIVMVTPGVDYKGPGMVHQCERGLLNFLRAGFSRLHEIASPGDWFARVDCDDHYCAGYMPELLKAKNSGAAWSCIAAPNVRLGSRVFECRPLYPEPTGLGGTLAGRIDAAASWTVAPGEDEQWCRDMGGQCCHVRGSDGYIYLRHRNYSHESQITERLIRELWHCELIDKGRFDCFL